MTIPIFSGDDAPAITQAAQALKDGQLVVLPTETVYGLGADADQDHACHLVYTSKGRPANHPLIVHVSSVEAAQHYAQEIPEFALGLINTFWPGPLTIIVKRKQNIGNAAAGGHKTIGLRCPAHPVALALLQAFEAIGGHGIAAPSANRFGRTSPTTALHVQQAFERLDPNPIAMVLDGQACKVGIESTIIDCSRQHPVLLRPGTLTLAELETAAGIPIQVHTTPTTGDPKASGTLSAHYAPKAKVRLMSAQDIRIATGLITASKPTTDTRFGIYARELPKFKKAPYIMTRTMPANAQDAAHELFAVLHEFDAHNVSLLWIETPPDEPEWIGVKDRLERAAASS